MRKKLLFIFNPTAGRGIIRDNVFEIIDLFTANDFLVTAYPTQKRRDAFDIVSIYAKVFDYIVCAGGDGTLNEVVDSIMSLTSKPILGYIPCGSTNDFATSLGIPFDILKAAKTVFNGVERKIDIGKFQNEYFSYIAAFGLFTDVSYGTPQDMKNIFGHAAYVLEGMKRLGSIKSYKCKIELDNEIFEDEFILGLITNSASVGGFSLPLQNCEIGKSCYFEIILLKNIENLSDLHNTITILMGDKQNKSDNFIVRSVKDVKITSSQPLDWTLDGEYGGSFEETNISILEKAITIMAPKE